MARKPTELKVLNGSYARHPERRTKSLPKSNVPLGKPPKDFTDDEKELWKELQVMSAYFTCVVDRWVAESTCKLMTKERHNTITVAERNQLLKGIAMMGMTPVDRARLIANDKQQDDNEFNEFDKVANVA